MAADPTLADRLNKAAAIAADAWGEPADADVPVIEIIGEPFTMSTADLRVAAVRLRKLDAIEDAAKWYGALGEGVQSGWDEGAYDEVSELLRRIADALGGTE